MAKLKYTLYIILLLSNFLYSQTSQITIPRIEQMPNEPASYNVRDWKDVAEKYDSFVYDLQKTGQYLPLIYINNSGVNYPDRKSFGLVTYVGTSSPRGNEAINVLPSLVGASLVGIDKTDQFGLNWVLMSQDFFNYKNGELLYLNNPNTSSGNDWWYDLMPNIYFYQLHDLYYNVGDADFQFVTIANRFREAVQKMGGSATPWSKAYMDYRAWDFSEMKPNPGGVIEPEAAGAYAWILYHAYKELGNPLYLQAAEWSMEFLSERSENPSYELQLPYGTYVAAKMNAEIGTDYDVEKMVNWSFNRGPLRDWGTIVGKWGGFDVSGLVGEANDNGNDYAFLLNGLQQAAALAPMTRYDKRFARAIGKWILNLANASRLFYPSFLPSSQQDSYDWANLYDPNRVIAHEALREKLNGKSPYSTGDAIGGGWAATNLSLYSSSSVGYLGAILEKTNVDKILKIDLLKTDFYKDEAYPTYLFFNPYNNARTIQLETGDEMVDVYESLSENFLLQGVSGTVNVTIPANQAIMVVLTPAGGTVSYGQNKMLVNGTVVDYHQTKNPFTYKPRIQALATAASEVELSDSITVFAKAFDQDSENLTYTWSTNGGTISGEDTTVNWIAPTTPGNYTITLIVSDGANNRDTAILELQAVPEINRAPQILQIRKSGAYVAPNDTLILFADAVDINGDSLTYTWIADGGMIPDTGSTVHFVAPASEGIVQIKLIVRDDKGLSAEATTSILVKNFASVSGNLIAYYPFSGNANDVSGNQLHGQVSGARLIPDFKNVPSSAYFFDGINDVIRVPANPILNFQDAITVSAWFKAPQFPERESFLVSHGSWQNRWKISITPERKLRWTINATSGTIRDLDSQITLQPDSIYQVVATYDGTLMAIYINGELNNYVAMSGKMRTTTLAFLIGQILPDDVAYNFNGIIDEVKLYNYALIPASVFTVYQDGLTTAIENIQKTTLLRLSPNPVSENLTIQLSENIGNAATLSIYALDGGRLIQQQKIASGSEQIILNTNTWSTGMYIAILRSANAVGVAKFVKQ